QNLTYFVQSGQFPHHSHSAHRGWGRGRKGTLVIQKVGQHRRVEMAQKGLKKCLDYREQPSVCRQNPCAGVQQLYQNGGGILVLAGANVGWREHWAISL